MKLGAKTLTPQEEALKLARKRFGAGAFTEDRAGFRLVGTRVYEKAAARKRFGAGAFTEDRAGFRLVGTRVYEKAARRILEWTGTGPTWEAAQQDLERAHPELLRKTEAEPCR